MYGGSGKGNESRYSDLLLYILTVFCVELKAPNLNIDISTNYVLLNCCT